jgi:hypothetical protein
MAGACSFYQFAFPDKVPLVTSVLVPNIIEVHQNTTKDLYQNYDKYTDEEKWEAIQPTLALLKNVNPESVEWIEYQHDNDLLNFDEKGTGYYAAYSPAFKYVALNESMFNLNDGLKASIIAHEFRHSRQAPSKFILAGLYLVISGELPTEYYEDEAEVYQQKVYYALLGLDV